MMAAWEQDEIVRAPPLAAAWQQDEVVAQPAPDPYANAPAGQGLNKIGRVLVQALASPAVLASKGAHKLASAAGYGDKVADLGPLLDTQLDKYAPHQGFVENLAKGAPAFAIPGGWIPQIAGNAAIGAVEAPAGQELKGAATGGAFGAAGQVLGKTIGGLVTPTKAAQELIDRGVALTPGQAAGTGTVAKRVEDWATSNPVASQFITGSQRRAIEEANRAAAEAVAGVVEQGKKLGLPPREAVEQTRDLIGKHYEQGLAGMRVPNFLPQGQFAQRLSRVAGDHPLLEQSQLDAMRKFVDVRIGNVAKNNQGTMTGDQLKQLDSEIGQHIRNLKSSTNAADKTAAPAWADLQAELREVMEMGARTPEQFAQISAANAAYRQLLAVEKAMLAGASSFTPRQLQRQLQNRGIEGTELNTVADAMQQTLPNAVPDSGTAERLIANLLPSSLMLGGAGVNELGFGTVGTGLMAAGALGSRTGAKLMTGGYRGQRQAGEAVSRALPATIAGMTRRREEER